MKEKNENLRNALLYGLLCAVVFCCALSYNMSVNPHLFEDRSTEVLIEDLTTEDEGVDAEEATTLETTDVSYEMYFTLEDVEMVAKTIYGEAGSSWIPKEDKACVAWVICNRVDDPRWADTIAGVVTSPKQFYGYKATNPVTDECRDIAIDVLTRWSLEKQGVDVKREVSSDINSFYGDGRSNHFYAAK